VVDVEGQLIVGNRQELKQKFSTSSRRGEEIPDRLQQTGYIDSSGLACSSRCRRRFGAGGELRLANLNDDLQTLFELTKLDTLFQISDTRERALESIFGGELSSRQRASRVDDSFYVSTSLGSADRRRRAIPH